MRQTKYEKEARTMIRWGLMRDPIWSEFGRIQRNLDDLAQLLGGTTRSSSDPRWRSTTIFPALNVTKDDNCYLVTAELPGIDPNELEIKVEGDTLNLKGERKLEQLGDGGSYHRRERAAGTFQRSLTLPHRVDAEGVKADYTDGVLTISLPVEKSAQPKQISVTTG
jgi:HSP20 family protein